MCMFWSCNYVWREKVKMNLMELLRLSKLVSPKLQYLSRRRLASSSIRSWKLSNKLLMDIVTIYYRRLTWDIKNLKQNIFFTFQSFLVIQWSSIHEIIRGPMCMVDKKNGVACANYYVQKLQRYSLSTYMQGLMQVSISKV